MAEDDVITVTYKAVLNENAAIAGTGNVNTATLTYGAATTEESTTTTYTYQAGIKKVDGSMPAVTLSGAEF